MLHRCPFENRARHFAGHLPQPVPLLHLVADRADINLRGPVSFQVHVNEEPDIDAVIILEPHFQQHIPPARNHAAERLGGDAPAGGLRRGVGGRLAEQRVGADWMYKSQLPVIITSNDTGKTRRG